MHFIPLCLSLLALVGRVSAADVGMPEKMAAKMTKVTPEMIAKITEACPAEPIAKPAKPRKVLVFSRCEGFPHGCITVCNQALVIMGEKTKAYAADISYDYEVFDAAKLAAYDAIILNNTTKLAIPEGAPRQALLDFVRNGKGIVGIHAAVDNFDKPAFPEALAMMGGVFAGHPWNAGGLWRFKVEEPKHPLVASLDPAGFTLKDEIYQYNEKITGRHNVRVLVTLDLSEEKTGNAGKGIDKKTGKPKNEQCRTDGDNPVVWVRQEGKGRVFLNGFGHNNEIFWNTPMLKLNLAGIQYAIGDLKADDALVPKK